MKLDTKRDFRENLQKIHIDFDKKQDAEVNEKAKFGESIGKIFRGLKPLLVY